MKPSKKLEQPSFSHDRWNSMQDSLSKESSAGQCMFLDAICQSLNLLTFKSHFMDHLFPLTFPRK